MGTSDELTDRTVPPHASDPAECGDDPGRRRRRQIAIGLTVWAGINTIVLLAEPAIETGWSAWQQNVSLRAVWLYEARVLSAAAAGRDSGPTDGQDTIRFGYRCFVPAGHRDEYSLPLFIFLHGSGERGRDNIGQLLGPPDRLCGSLAEPFPCAVLVPQCPKNVGWSTPLTTSLDMLDVVILMMEAMLEDPRIDPNRVYLCGFSMGGYGASELAARCPDRFAAVVPIAGPGSPEHAEALRNVPMWVVHSEDDRTADVEGARKMVAALRKAGGHPRYLELTDAGHGAWRPVFVRDSPVLEWMFQQRTDP